MTERELFLKALELTDAAEQQALLDQVAADQPDLRKKLEQLLLAHAQAGTFLDQPHPAARSPESTGAFVLAHASEEQVGTVIAGRYTLLERIGEGGMGEVWVAEQSEPVKRKVGLKLIKPGMDSKQVLYRFDAERQALAMMDHPNIAKVFDGGVTERGRPYFAMEYVKGIPLTRHCDDNLLTIPERLELFVQICQAVQHAHQKGIVHRDLKPSNILIALYDDRPVAKVIDFGLAKALHYPLTEQVAFTSHGMAVGTPMYMSPEQAQFNNLDVDTRTDIYSLGVILYELLTGSTPLEKQRVREAAWNEILRIIREEEPPKPSTKLSTNEKIAGIAAQRRIEPVKLNKLLRGELDWIVMKALEKVRNRRYDTVGNLAQDIRHFLHDEPVLARPPSKLYRVRKFIQRHRNVVITAGVIVGLLLTGVVATLLLLWRALHAEQMWRDETSRANASAVQARASEEITASINEFLTDDILLRVDALRRAGAGSNPFGSPSLPDSLDQAVAGVAAGNQPPLVKAGLYFIIGKAYHALGLHQKAQAPLERALELRRQELGENHHQVIEVELETGRLMIDQTKYSAAHRFLEQLAQKCSRAVEPNHPWHSLIRNDVALAKEGLGNFPAAEALHRQNLESFNTALAPPRQALIDVRVRLAHNLMMQRRLDEAEQEYLEAMNLQRDLTGPESARMAAMMTNLGIVYRRMFVGSERKQVRYLARGEELCRQAAGLAERLYGKEHPEHLVARLALGNILYDAGKLVECESTFAALNDALLRRADPAHDLVLSSRLTYAAVLKKHGKALQAKPILLETFEQISRKYPPGDQRVRTVLEHLIDCLRLLGETELEKEYARKRWRS